MSNTPSGRKEEKTSMAYLGRIPISKTHLNHPFAHTRIGFEQKPKPASSSDSEKQQLQPEPEKQAPAK